MIPFYMMRQNSQDMYCVKEVIDQNEYRLPEQFPPYSTIIDLGANIGCFALAALSRGASKVDCYEPEWENLKLLKHNLEQTAKDDRIRGTFHINGVAVWNARGKSAINSSGPSFTAMYRTELVPANDAGFSVETITMADILAKHGLIELVKIDVEGAELPILNGWARDVGPDHKVRAVCGEIHYALKVPGYDYKPSREWLETILPMLGFGHIEITSDATRGNLVGHFWAHR